jgi:hypothetical protein
VSRRFARMECEISITSRASSGVIVPTVTMPGQERHGLLDKVWGAARMYASWLTRHADRHRKRANLHSKCKIARMNDPTPSAVGYPFQQTSGELRLEI